MNKCKCEFAIFTPAELAGVAFAPGRVIWQAEGLETSALQPVQGNAPPPVGPVEWLVGEALTNLYVGLCCYGRGEKLSAQRSIQGYAVDRLVVLADRLTAAGEQPPDPFAGARSFEARFPELARHLPEFIQGYERSPESAGAILAFLERHFEVNLSLKKAIRAQIDGSTRR